MTSKKGDKRSTKNSQLSVFNSMRAAAWVSDLKRRTGVSSDIGLLKAIPTIEGMVVRFGRYLSGVHVPSEMIRNAVHAYPPVRMSRFVFEFGPEDQGGCVSLWMLFQDCYDEFWTVIEDVIPRLQTAREEGHHERIDRIATIFCATDTWADIRLKRAYLFEQNNPVQAYMDEFQVTPELRFLAAAIAIWRLSMLVREGEEATEYLLQCLLTGPYVQVLETHGIYEHICFLIRAIAVRHYLMQGQANLAAKIFSEIYKPTKKRTANRKGEKNTDLPDSTEAVFSFWNSSVLK
ncbi:hypothetical protein [Undibacterium oligocarboniphilum]|uniref:Uncharacterized protein n=1 Tax=Undibacterium oligocarboniphilum TaxID=666702 RepID=A0A850QA53_9BURK|nr:hypothetical protein [Undibacterium oligocarboniphilum]MBC3871149.1 hypothetical protein [Undibacterium oligocarboniphilum]NVO76228.1 hypothetical protein [Undibacterium oligocarboniphilum]